jgi:hypothetical protein
MMVDKKFLSDALERPIEVDIRCATLGLVDSGRPKTLTFLDDRRFLSQLQANRNISAVITTTEHYDCVKNTDIAVLISDDPRYDFYSIYNYLCQKTYASTPTRIDRTAIVHPQAYVSDYNVTIGAGCIIEPMACVMPDVEIGERCIIRAGAVVGLEGYEKKWTRKGVLSVIHTGKALPGHVHRQRHKNQWACLYWALRLDRQGLPRSSFRIRFWGLDGRRQSLDWTESDDIQQTSGWNWRAHLTRLCRDHRCPALWSRHPPCGHVTGNFAVEHEIFISNLKKSIGRS